jgi:hypothetical protein
MMTGKTVSDISPVLKHWKFWIDSIFATTGKIYRLSCYMMAYSDMDIKNSLYTMINSLKNHIRERS